MNKGTMQSRIEANLKKFLKMELVLVIPLKVETFHTLELEDQTEKT
jgi:hypothetical protein